MGSDEFSEILFRLSELPEGRPRSANMDFNESHIGGTQTIAIPVPKRPFLLFTPKITIIQQAMDHKIPV